MCVRASSVVRSVYLSCNMSPLFLERLILGVANCSATSLRGRPTARLYQPPPQVIESIGEDLREIGVLTDQLLASLGNRLHEFEVHPHHAACDCPQTILTGRIECGFLVC